MPAFTDITIIYNPHSTGDAPSNAQELRDHLAETLPKANVELLQTKRAGHALDLAYEYAKNHAKPLIISASGDGGYNEVINGALKAQAEGAKPICAVLPSGNANDHARTMQDKPLAELIAEQAVTTLDVLKIATTSEDGKHVERYAHSYIGLGLTPTVAIELNKRTLNSLVEAWIVLKTFWNLRPVRVVSQDKQLRLDSLICSTIPEMAKVLTISEKSKPRDGLFELTLFEHHHKRKLIYRLARGLVKSLGIHSRTDKYEFTVLSPTPIQLDGEVIQLAKNTDVSITICPRYLRTLA